MRLYKDLLAFSNFSKKKMIVTIATNPNFHCVCLFRLSNLLYRYHLSFLSKFIWYINRIVFSVDIDYRASLAGGFVIKHGIGLVIGKDVKSLGKLTVYQGVTLGGNNEKTQLSKYGLLSQPLLEENVIIYTGSMIFGPIIIGKDNIIGAGSKVFSSVPPKEKKGTQREDKYEKN